MNTGPDRRAIKALLDKTRREMKPVLERMRAAEVNAPEGTEAIMIAQNTMRICLETVLREMLPYDEVFLTELGVRLAAYCVTAGPPAARPVMTATIQNVLPGMVEMKVAQGTGIRAEWVSPTEIN